MSGRSVLAKPSIVLRILPQGQRGRDRRESQNGLDRDGAEIDSTVWGVGRHRLGGSSCSRNARPEKALVGRAQ